jgi:hypothetical protein
VVIFLSREGISGVIVSLSVEAPSQAPEIAESESDEIFETPIDDPIEQARLGIEALFARQSKTLEQAIARYTLKRGRSPPPNYDRWFQFAQERSCLIDEYDQIYRDFEPFYRMAKEDAHHFQRMIERGASKIHESPVEIAVVEIKDGEVHLDAGPEVAYISNWPITLGRVGSLFDVDLLLAEFHTQFSAYLPDMKFLLNSRDEPRVVFNLRDEGALEKAFRPEDPTPFEIAPRPTGEFFKHQSGCVITQKTPGFANSINDDTACGYIYSTSRRRV